MAKQTAQQNEIQANDVRELLNSFPQLPTVYKWAQVLNRAFVVYSIEWRVFDNGGERADVTVVFMATNETAVIECGARGLTEPLAMLEKAQQFPCKVKIVQKGKFPILAPA